MSPETPISAGEGEESAAVGPPISGHEAASDVIMKSPRSEEAVPSPTPRGSPLSGPSMAVKRDAEHEEPSEGQRKKRRESEGDGMRVLEGWNEFDYDICEVYSPPRISTRAQKWKLKGGWALDLTTRQETGEPWDFDLLENRIRAKRLRARERPN